MAWLPSNIWDYGDPYVNARLPALSKYTSHLIFISVIQQLIAWRRDDLACALYNALPANTKYRIDEFKPGLLNEPVNTIGRRKGNKENRGEYAGGARAVIRNERGAPAHFNNPCSIYLPSLKAFLRGSMGHVYTGIIVRPGGFNGLSEPRDKEMMFLAANDPPTPQQQQANAISEPYLNRTFTNEVVSGPNRQFRGAQITGSSGYQSWNAQTNTMEKNDQPIVHGGNGLQSHEQLRRMIVGCNRYQGIITTDPGQDGQGMFIGFTVMKGGINSKNIRKENVYGWTSNSMNRNAFVRPAGAYLKRINAEIDEINYKLDQKDLPSEEWNGLFRKRANLLARKRSQVSGEFAQKIKIALDRLLELQLSSRDNDPYFKGIISAWGSHNI